ncbi:MAG: hypothetical protein LBR81_01480 [Prevotellaceae bacterium]|jgi:hypothetical protein|nr:hypothetical protein [Prevotellaceae bacterium]
MKQFKLILIVLVLLTSACRQKAKQEVTATSDTIIVVPQDYSDTVAISDEDPNKFLISNNAAGYFKIGGSWQNFAENNYQYRYKQGYATCVDGCCTGGFSLGDGILTIGTSVFEYGESFNDEIDSKKHVNNPDVFYVSSDNCKAWYWKDSISSILIYSDLFQTKEGVGVGTTLEDAQKQFGKLVFKIGWIEEDANAVQFTTSAYPAIKFVLNTDDYMGSWEELSNLNYRLSSNYGKENLLTISNFKKNTTIKHIIIRGENE